MSAISIVLPQLPYWLLRLAAEPSVCLRMMRNPVLFATWYAPVGSSLPWPAAVEAIQATERKKKHSLEKMSSLLSKVDYAVDGGPRNIDYVRRIVEGVAVHAWAVENREDFSAVVEQTLKTIELHYEELTNIYADAFGQRTRELADLLELGKLERELLLFGFGCAASIELRTLFSQLDASNPLPPHVFANLFRATPSQLRDALSAQSPLRLAGLLRTQGNVNRYPVVSAFWIRLLTEAPDDLVKVLTEPMPFRATSGVPARLEEEDLELAARVLSDADGKGVNLLLYGAGNLDRQAALRSIMKRAGKVAYQLVKHEDMWEEKATFAYIAQRALAKHYPEGVLVIDRPGEVLEHTANANVFRKLFGLDVDNGEIEPFDELMLSTNPTPCLWLTAGAADELGRDTVARFVFQAPLHKARREDRRAQLEAMVKEMGLSDDTSAQLLVLEDISAIQLETALRAAKLSGAKTDAEREAALVKAVNRSLRAMGRATKAKAKESVTQYSLDYVNCAGRFGPVHVLEALRKKGRGKVCLYGLPGTGKTQYVEYMAEVLGRPLIAKKASDILSKWLGEAEKNIAAMFEEAAKEENCILFLDEGDTFVRSRDRAKAHWEVSQVNELLQQMERFDGIFILSTNLFKGLDAAVLRRFTFKLEFLPLDLNQKWRMFLTESGLGNEAHPDAVANKDACVERLLFMPFLCAGDFAVVKNQCILMDETLTPAQWLEQLEIECRVKSGGDDPEAKRATTLD